MGIFGRRKRQPPPPPPPPMRLSYQVGSMQGIGTRPNQEDAFGGVNVSDLTMIQQRGLFLAVSDGMGGMADGQEASQTVIASLSAMYDSVCLDRPLGPQLRAMAAAAGDQVCQRLGGAGGATLVACTIYQEALNWVSVGDSYLFLRRNNRIYQINQEQTCRARLYGELVEEGVMDSASADQDPDGHRLSSFLGMPELALEPECSLRSMRLLDGDTVLLCSDGVGGVLSPWELLSCMQAPTPAEMCAAMDAAIRAKNRKFQDNYTAVAVQCGY